MAVMARLEGIPSRIAVGYAPGRSTGETVSLAGQGALPEYEVDARDAHAWPELYFQGLGWVPFEPTPSRGVVPDYATETVSPGSPDLNEDNDGLLPDSTAPAPTPGATPAPLPGQGGGDEIGQLLLPWLAGAAGVLVLLLLMASPRLVRTGIRARRLQSAPPGTDVPGTVVPATGIPGTDVPATDDPVPLAWAELRDLGTDYGLPPESSETPRAYSERLRNSSLLGGTGGTDDAAHQAVLTLTSDFERRHYGPPGNHKAGARKPERVAPRIAAVQQSLRDNASLPWRLRADWLPASVLGRWARFLAAPFQGVGKLSLRMAKAAARSLSRVRDGLFRPRGSQ
jgi:hypothetical protein